MDYLSPPNGSEIEELDLSRSAVLSVSEASPVLTFDYSGVSSMIAREAEEAAARIRGRHRESIIDTGKDLLSVKGKLDHGKFGQWLRFHFCMTERTAENYMNAARSFEATPLVIDVLPANTVYKLAAKGIPAEIRQSVLDEISSGTIPHHKDIEARVVAAKKDERRKRADEREKQAEERAWHKHVKSLKTAGKTDDEINAEQKRWETRKARKIRKTELKQAAEEARKKRHQEQMAEFAERRRQIEANASRAAEILRKKLGEDFDKIWNLISAMIHPDYRPAFDAA